MVFNSPKFFFFLTVVWLVHYFLGQRFRWILLLVASLIFYASLKVPYLLGVIALVTVTTYGFGIWIHWVEQPKQKKWVLWGGIAVNVLILMVMKYVPFLTENFNVLFSFFSDSPIKVPHAQLLVAIGVSYYVFQAISYLSDIYLEIEEPEIHLGYFALYLAFFPKLLQGPIERARDLIPQLKQKYEFNYDNMRFGMLLFSWGLFKKVVLADRLGLYVDAVYGDVYSFQGLPLLLATYAYAFQIYFDFSGYTDMALGTARLFNIRLTNNFNSPYLATSVADFWRRWHITFSRWILDYIFKPLQMSWRNWKNWGTAAALIVAFFVSGLWHGASWGFIVWGLLHGLYLAFSVGYKPYQKKVHKLLGIEKTNILKAWQIFITFNLVSFAWVFFKCSNLNDAIYVIKNFFPMRTVGGDFLMQLGKAHLIILVTSLTLLLVARCLRENGLDINGVLQASFYVRWFVYITLMICVLWFGMMNNLSFVYMRF